MHEVTVFTCLEQHTLKFQELGLKIEQLGKEIQEHNDQLTLEYGQLIEECGKVIQQKIEEVNIYVQVAIELAEEAQTNTQVAVELEDYYTDLKMHITRSQLEARVALINALNIFAQMMQETIKLVGKHL